MSQEAPCWLLWASYICLCILLFLLLSLCLLLLLSLLLLLLSLPLVIARFRVQYDHHFLSFSYFTEITAKYEKRGKYWPY